jgi:hypothetical protein
MSDGLERPMEPIQLENHGFFRLPGTRAQQTKRINTSEKKENNIFSPNFGMPNSNSQRKARKETHTSSNKKHNSSNNIATQSPLISYHKETIGDNLYRQKVNENYHSTARALKYSTDSTSNLSGSKDKSVDYSNSNAFNQYMNLFNSGPIRPRVNKSYNNSNEIETRSSLEEDQMNHANISHNNNSVKKSKENAAFIIAPGKIYNQSPRSPNRNSTHFLTF